MDPLFVGSNPIFPNIKERETSSIGRAFDLQLKGSGFEPRVFQPIIFIGTTDGLMVKKIKSKLKFYRENAF